MEWVEAADEIRHWKMGPFQHRGHLHCKEAGRSIRIRVSPPEWPLLALRLEGQEAWKYRQALEAGKGEKTDSSRKVCNLPP